jgi:regulator of cell morphogenesis and NO signaling
MENLEQQRLADIVTQLHSSASVFERFKLDYCCKGKRTLAQACEEQHVPLNQVVGEIESLLEKRHPQHSFFTEMTPSELSRYIVERHHHYVRQAIPSILHHLEKVYHKHGERYPYMTGVYMRFRKVAAEMESHMMKEEKILFPMMGRLAMMGKEQVMAPIRVMEAEHDEAGRLMEEIRDLTSDYHPADDACTTHRLVIEELKTFEEDLHQHVYLENHILFPMATEQAGVN